MLFIKQPRIIINTLSVFVSRNLHNVSWSHVITSHEAFPGSVVSGAICSSVVRAFAHGAMGHRIDPSWSGPIELFLVPASAPRLV